MRTIYLSDRKLLKSYNPNLSELRAMSIIDDIGFCLEYIHGHFKGPFNPKWLKDPEYKGAVESISVGLRALGYKIT